jgi:hypothetical protein
VVVVGGAWAFAGYAAGALFAAPRGGTAADGAEPPPARSAGRPSGPPR